MEVRYILPLPLPPPHFSLLNGALSSQTKTSRAHCKNETKFLSKTLPIAQSFARPFDLLSRKYIDCNNRNPTAIRWCVSVFIIICYIVVVVVVIVSGGIASIVSATSECECYR